MYNWILCCIFAVFIILDFKSAKEMVIRTEKKSLEKITYIAGMVIIFAVIIIFANDISNYILGALGVTLFLAGYLHNGLSEKGFVSIYKGARFLSYKDTEKVIVERNKKNVQVFYTGKGISFKLSFCLKDFKAIEKLLKEKIPREKVKIEYRN